VSLLFGFLSDSRTFAVDLPPDVHSNYELMSSVQIQSEQAFSVQCRRADTMDFTDFAWERSFQINAQESAVDVYESSALPDALMPVWSLPGWNVWVQVRARGGVARSEMLGALAQGLKVSSDERGIPRISFGRGLEHGDPYGWPLNRDHVMFQTDDANMLLLRYDQALGTEGTFRDGDLCWAETSTPFGITVERTGLLDQREQVIRDSQRVATSVREVAA
jgi:hypothetical protein